MTKKKKKETTVRCRPLPADDPMFRQGWRVISCDGPVGGTGRLSEQQQQELWEAMERFGGERPEDVGRCNSDEPSGDPPAGDASAERPDELPTAEVVPFARRRADGDDETDDRSPSGSEDES